MGRARGRLAEPGASPQAVLAELAAEVAGQGELLKAMTADTKELHGTVSKLGKVRHRVPCSGQLFLACHVCVKDGREAPIEKVQPGRPIPPCHPVPQIVERSFSQDIAKAYKADRPLDAAALNQVSWVGGRDSRPAGSSLPMTKLRALPAWGAPPAGCS